MEVLCGMSTFFAWRGGTRPRRVLQKVSERRHQMLRNEMVGLPVVVLRDRWPEIEELRPGSCRPITRRLITWRYADAKRRVRRQTGRLSNGVQEGWRY